MQKRLQLLIAMLVLVVSVRSEERRVWKEL